MDRLALLPGDASQTRGPSPFASFFMGGFEGSSHRRHDGVQLDMIAKTRHDRCAAQDYELVAGCGVRTVRDALRWHLIESAPGRYDWSSALPMLQAAQAAGVQVIWDLCHYGVPRDLDIWSAAFVDRYAAFAGHWARLVAETTDPARATIYCPMNEISFWAWAGGDQRRMYPDCRGRGGELKRQLVRATLAAIEAVRAINPQARFMQAEPLINVLARAGRGEETAPAANYHVAQYEACDMIAGRMAPELGGTPAHLDLIGLNYYYNNQWVRPDRTIPVGHRRYRPLADLLAEVHARYRRPMLLSETGAEAGNGPGWLRYISGELRTAMRDGLPILGACLYPVMDYPGWENGRHCRCGLIRLSPDWRERSLDPALVGQLREEQRLLDVAPNDVSSAIAPNDTTETGA